MQIWEEKKISKNRSDMGPLSLYEWVFLRTYFISCTSVTAVTDMLEMFTCYLFLPSIFCCFSKVYRWMDRWNNSPFWGLNCCPCLFWGLLCLCCLRLLTAETGRKDGSEAWWHVTKVACQIGGYTACMWVIWAAATPSNPAVYSTGSSSERNCVDKSARLLQN